MCANQCISNAAGALIQQLNEHFHELPFKLSGQYIENNLEECEFDVIKF